LAEQMLRSKTSGVAIKEELPATIVEQEGAAKLPP